MFSSPQEANGVDPRDGAVPAGLVRAVGRLVSRLTTSRRTTKKKDARHRCLTTISRKHPTLYMGGLFFFVIFPSASTQLGSNAAERRGLSKPTKCCDGDATAVGGVCFEKQKTHDSCGRNFTETPNRYNVAHVKLVWIRAVGVYPVPTPGALSFSFLTSTPSFVSADDISEVPLPSAPRISTCFSRCT